MAVLLLLRFLRRDMSKRNLEEKTKRSKQGFIPTFMTQKKAVPWAGKAKWTPRSLPGTPAHDFCRSQKRWRWSQALPPSPLPNLE